MPDEALLTLSQIAQRLGLPESTTRYYRDAFLDHVPQVGTGRRRRYPLEAVEVLRTIAAAYATGHTHAEVRAQLDPRDVPVTALVPSSHHPVRRSGERAAHLDLLAAIIERDKGQRDVLWQMAEGLARMTEILDGQNRVLTALADRIGENGGRQPAPTAEGADPAPASLAADVTSAADDAARLKAELVEERSLVERLRDARLQLERRAAEAEAALAEQRARPRRGFVRRILGDS
jgi:DNA-binding transcriptional MerR regulator